MVEAKEYKPPTKKEAEEKLRRISRAKEELLKLYSEIPENKKTLAEKLIDRASFLMVSLEDLENFINENGYVDFYKNGANQHGLKKSPQAELYTNWQKNFQNSIDGLAKLLPDGSAIPSPGGITEAFKKGNERRGK